MACGGSLAERKENTGANAQKTATLARPAVIAPKHIAERVLRARDAMRGERKAVTVLFADIKGSTTLVERQDPEEASLILEPVLRGMIEAVHRFDGLVSKVMGDGVMALFGAPLALEDHAVRACYAALAMRQAVREKAAELRRVRGIELQVRIGLNSGEVVVQGVGTDLHMEYDAIGATVHLAARMEQTAPPDRIRLTSSTAGLVGGSMALDALGPIPVAGFTAPVSVFELLGNVEPEFRAEAAAPSPLVGRAGELEILREAARRVGKGRGQTVAITGEAGIGKSRLCFELVRELRAEGWLCLTARAAPHETDEPWLAIRHMLRSFFGPVTDPESAQRARDQIAMCDQTLAAATPAIFELMGADVREPSWRALKPAERRQRMIDACRGWLVAESRTRPLLVLADDFQWMDTETDSLLRSVADFLKSAPILLVTCSRSDDADRPVFAAATNIRLQPLEPMESAELLDHLMGENTGARDARARLIARTGGNPLYLSEIARALSDTGELSPETLPPTVQAIIAARIDALPALEKALLQAASVLGHEFELVHLSQTVAKDEEEVRTSLASLQARGFVQERRIFPEVSFGFDQPLVLEVAYRSMLKEGRRELHRSAFLALQRTKGESCALSVGSLAHHSFEAGLWEDAARLCRLAGRRAAAQSAYREAASLYRNALAATANTDGAPGRQEQEIDIRIELRHVLFPTGQFAEIGRILEEAHEAAEVLGDKARLALVLLHETTHHLGAGRHREAINAGVRALALAQELGDHGVERDVLFHLVQANASSGDYSSAISFGEHLLTAPVDGPSGVTTSSLARMWLAWCSAELGLFDDAHRHAEAAFSVSRNSDQPLPILLAHLGRGIVHLREERFAEAAAWLEPALSFSEQPNLRAWWGALGSPLGRAWLGLGRIADAVSLLEKVVAHSATSRGSGHVLRSIHLGEAYLAAERVPDAMKIAAEAHDLARAHGERGHEAYALLLLAEVARTEQRLEAALVHAQSAEQLSSELHMRPLRQRVAALFGSSAGLMAIKIAS
jgi:class 3 adenylate cyclase/tetratricopeptide (TPR) repeat protein